MVSAAGNGTDSAAKKYSVSLKIELLAPTADPVHGYRLNPRHSILRDDEHKIVISPAGLLTSTDITATDRTADIIAELATFAGAILQGPAPGAARSDRERDKEKKCVGAPSEFTAVVDLADSVQVRQLNYNLQCIGARVLPLDLHLAQASKTFGNTGDRFSGLVYRTPIDVFFTIEKCTLASAECKPDGTGWFPNEVLALSLPQAGPISYVRQDAGLHDKNQI